MYSRVRMWRTLESMMTAVAMDSKSPKVANGVRGGSYTGITVWDSVSETDEGRGPEEGLCSSWLR